MPLPTHPDRYPVVYEQAIQRAVKDGSFTIPCPDGPKLRLHIYGYLTALRKHGDATIADALTFTTTPTSCTISLRDLSPEARAIQAALNTPSENPDDIL